MRTRGGEGRGRDVEPGGLNQSYGSLCHVGSECKLRLVNEAAAIAPESEHVDAPVGLRERRRRETLREVSDAAIDLFERHGVHGTTVDDIAHAAGISQRTFFRYYPTKEHALFVDDEGFGAVMRRTVAEIREGAPVVSALEAGWLLLFDDFDRRPEEHRRALRVRRLIQNEPSLLALALANDAEHADELTAAAVEAAGADADVLIARAVVAAVTTTIRLAFDEWARRAEEGTPSSARGIYLQLRRGLATYAAELGRPPSS
ncbi:TetR family transcriptional regulator [Microbacterium sp. BWT-G7]|uniref:TetR family transcriptional regulator n=1 Tax=Microbacterium allomyrinae TaxID=2830666 RepID=A0A9X1LTA0_9MICO|nr:TetR family transcriptional regulator [Microbacterium allomyrinae]